MDESPTEALLEAVRHMVRDVDRDLDAAQSKMESLVRHYGSSMVGAALRAVWEETGGRLWPHWSGLPEAAALNEPRSASDQDTIGP